MTDGGAGRYRCLIWHLRGYAQAAQQLTLSAMSHLELLQGMRNKVEMSAVQHMFEKRHASILPITPVITQRATALMTSLSLRHGLQAGDALIAATALEHRLRLLTGNTKHFAPIPGLEIETFALSPA